MHLATYTKRLWCCGAVVVVNMRNMVRHVVQANSHTYKDEVHCSNRQQSRANINLKHPIKSGTKQVEHTTLTIDPPSRQSRHLQYTVHIVATKTICRKNKVVERYSPLSECL